jgi:polyhydroxyalkanoate synthesis regulator phasin
MSEISSDPSLATNERLADSQSQSRLETRGWVDALQVLLEEKVDGIFRFLVEKIDGGLLNITTRLNGNDTALVAALQAQKEAAAEQTKNFSNILDESKKGMTKQIDALSDKIDDLKERVNVTGGQTAGVSHTLLMIIAIVGALTGIGSLVISSRGAAPAPQYQSHTDKT